MAGGGCGRARGCHLRLLLWVDKPCVAFTWKKRYAPLHPFHVASFRAIFDLCAIAECALRVFIWGGRHNVEDLLDAFTAVSAAVTAVAVQAASLVVAVAVAVAVSVVVAAAASAAAALAVDVHALCLLYSKEVPCLPAQPIHRLYDVCLPFLLPPSASPFPLIPSFFSLCPSPPCEVHTIANCYRLPGQIQHLTRTMASAWHEHIKVVTVSCGILPIEQCKF